MAADGISAEVLYPTLAKGLFEQFFFEPVDLPARPSGRTGLQRLDGGLLQGSP